MAETAAEDSLREEAARALYAELSRVPVSARSRHVWVMSPEWFFDIRMMFPPPGSSLNPENWADYRNLLGRPVVLRDDAGFPKLVSA